MKKIKQTYIARKIKISDGYLSEILSGKKTPSWKTAKKLAEATGSQPELWLEGGPEEKKRILSTSHSQD